MGGCSAQVEGLCPNQVGTQPCATECSGNEEVDSAGGTGNLRLWLVRAVGHTISAGAPCVTAAHLRAEIMADLTLRQLLEAAQSGEALFGKLYSALDATITSVFTGVSVVTTSSTRPHGSRYHPGKRNPQRDPTGAAA